MKVNYLSKDIENEDKIPENVIIRTMQSDLARLKEISKRKPTETSKGLPNKMSKVNLKEEFNDFYPKKPLKKPAGEKIKKPSSFLSFHKKAAPPAQLPTEKSEKELKNIKQQPSAKIPFNETEEKRNINITEKKEDAVEFSLQNQPLEKKKEDITTDNVAGNAAIGLEKKTKTKKSGKKIILIVVLIIILICLGLAFYNFFILQNENEKTIFPEEETEKPEEPKKEKPKSIIPKIPFISDFQKPEIPTIQPFISIKQIFSFISSDKKFDLISVLGSYLETLKEIPEVALIEIRDENKILDLEKLSQKINIEIPEEITDNLSKNNYALIFLNLENELRLGLVAEVNGGDMEKIQKNARQWETTMIDDLKLLFLKTEIGSPSTANFQENTYKGIKIRYMNFSEPNVTIDYAFANNKLILATSKENIYKIIDILKK
jgi:hypothetical protein